MSASESVHSRPGKKLLMEVTFLPEKDKTIPYLRIQVFDTENPLDLLLSVKDRMRKQLLIWKKKGIPALQIKKEPYLHVAGEQNSIRREMVFSAPRRHELKNAFYTQILLVDSFFPGKRYMVKVSLCSSLKTSSRYKAAYEELVEGFRFSGDAR